MAQGVGHRPHAAERVADDVDLAQPQVLAQRLDIVRHLLDRARCHGHPLGAAGVAVIDVDELHIGGEGGEMGLVVRVVHGWAAMQDEGHVLLFHHLAIRDQS